MLPLTFLHSKPLFHNASLFSGFKGQVFTSSLNKEILNIITVLLALCACGNRKISKKEIFDICIKLINEGFLLLYDATRKQSEYVGIPTNNEYRIFKKLTNNNNLFRIRKAASKYEKADNVTPYNFQNFRDYALPQLSKRNSIKVMCGLSTFQHYQNENFTYNQAQAA